MAISSTNQQNRQEALLHAMASILKGVPVAKLPADGPKDEWHAICHAMNRVVEYVQKLEEERDALVQHLGFGVLAENAQGSIIYANQTFVDMFSVPAVPEALIGADCWEAAEQAKILFVNSEGFVDRIREIINKKCLVKAEELVLKDKRVFERDYIPLSGRGSYRGHLWQFRDVTEQRAAQELRSRFVEKVIQAQDADRHQIAREIHDEFGSALTSITIGLRVLQDLKSTENMRRQSENVNEVAVRTLDGIYRLARWLHPQTLEQLGLHAALKQYTEHVQKTNPGTRIHVHVAGRWEDLPLATTTQLYRVFQEALTNAMKHAQAENITVLADREQGTIRLIIEDDGVGFDPDAHEADLGANTLGLAGMRERISLLRGEVQFESPPGGGTTVAVRIPGSVSPSA